MDLWNDLVTWPEIQARMRAEGVLRAQAKFLKRNHNSKNQIFVGLDLSELAHWRPGLVTGREGRSNKAKAGQPIFQAPLKFLWLHSTGVCPAPEAKLIFYPQYPEVRLSGFLTNSTYAPRELLQVGAGPKSRGQEEGRVLIVGVNANEQLVAALVSRRSPAAHFLKEYDNATGRLIEIALGVEQRTSKEVLVAELRKICEEGWINSHRLFSDGSVKPCMGTNCHGITLESMLGVSSNGLAAPDFLDWEVKAHRVAHLRTHLSSRITLLTPSPDGGLYKEHDTAWLVENFGKQHSAYRRDLSGVHVAEVENTKTSLVFGAVGFDKISGKVTDESGLLFWDHVPSGQRLASWSFAKLLTHWSRKHAKSIFVPCIQHPDLGSFSYGSKVHIGEGTTFNLFLAAVAAGTVVLDPGLNAKLGSNNKWMGKTRFQFRASLNRASSLYTSFSAESLRMSANLPDRSE